MLLFKKRLAHTESFFRQIKRIKKKSTDLAFYQMNNLEKLYPLIYLLI